MHFVSLHVWTVVLQMDVKDEHQIIRLSFLLLDEQSSSNHLMADLSRKMPWSDQETRTLLEIWGDNNIQLTLRGCLKNRHVFEYISEKMSEHGFMRTSEQCYTRIKRLKYSFLHEKYVKAKHFYIIVSVNSNHLPVISPYGFTCWLCGVSYGG